MLVPDRRALQVRNRPIGRHGCHPIGSRLGDGAKQPPRTEWQWLHRRRRRPPRFSPTIRSPPNGGGFGRRAAERGLTDPAWAGCSFGSSERRPGESLGRRSLKPLSAADCPRVVCQGRVKTGPLSPVERWSTPVRRGRLRTGARRAKRGGRRRVSRRLAASSGSRWSRCARGTNSSRSRGRGSARMSARSSSPEDRSSSTRGIREPGLAHIHFLEGAQYWAHSVIPGQAGAGLTCQLRAGAGQPFYPIGRHPCRPRFRFRADTPMSPPPPLSCREPGRESARGRDRMTSRLYPGTGHGTTILNAARSPSGDGTQVGDEAGGCK